MIEQRALLVRDEALRGAFCIASTAAEVPMPSSGSSRPAATTSSGPI